MGTQAKSQGNHSRRSNQRNNGKPANLKNYGCNRTHPIVEGTGTAIVQCAMLCNCATLYGMMRAEKLVRRWTRQRI